MNPEKLSVGDTFKVHFVWKLPDEDYARALFEAKIIEIQPREDRYLVILDNLLGARQEAADGTTRTREQMRTPTWARIMSFIGRKVQLAYESADGRPLYMRYTTLTGANKFFDRFVEKPAADDEAAPIA